MIVDKLSNGLRYCIDSNGARRSAAIYFLVNVGSVNEKKKQYGMAHFLEHMLFKGTEKRLHSKNITNNIYKLGGTTNAFTSYDMTGYYISIGHEFVADAIEILADILFNSTFRDMEEEKGVVISENKRNTSSPQTKFYLKFNEMMYKCTPYQHDIGGINTYIKKFTKKMVIDFYKKFYFPENIVLSIAGKVPKNIKSIVRKHFNKKMKRGRGSAIEDVLVKDFMEMQRVPRSLSMITKNLDQAEIVIGFPCYDYNDRRSHVLVIASTVLGGNMSSRLAIKLREELGLVYTVSSSVDTNIDSGDFTVSAGTFLNKVGKVIHVIIEELVKMRDNGITEDELKNSVNFTCGMMDLNNENNDSKATWNGYNLLKLNKILDIEEQKKIFRSITNGEIMCVLKDVIKFNKMNLGVLSNKKHVNTVKREQFGK